MLTRQQTPASRPARLSGLVQVFGAALYLRD